MPLFLFFLSLTAVCWLYRISPSGSREVKMAEETKKDKKKTAGGLFIPAGLFIGMGVGWALGFLVQGTLVGLGLGFLLFGIVMLVGRD